MQNEKKQIEKMTIGDVLSTDEYKANLQDIINELRATRQNAKAKGELKSHSIDVLTKSDLFHVGFMTGAYREILDKCSPYSSAIRAFIRDVCTEAFNKTMVKFVQDEKDADKLDGND